MHRTREPDVGGGGLAEAGTGETETWWWMPWHGGSLAEEGSQARDRRVRSVAPRVVRCRGGDRGGARARLHRDRGRIVQTTEPDDGGQSPRHEAWCAAPVDALTALSHTPESPHPKRCPPVLPASRCCFAPSRSVPSYTPRHTFSAQYSTGAWLCGAGRTFGSRTFQAP